jgi:hypothetical protein
VIFAILCAGLEIRPYRFLIVVTTTPAFEYEHDDEDEEEINRTLNTYKVSARNQQSNFGGGKRVRSLREEIRKERD